ncbi:hypothetical protein SLEP1_g4242 [Rubroshorea leprosula]|uniref:DUF4228 domain-containing protein n=1 Tax=Rubroshorea leprosula TaxID=152421 RepID=A0AAV5HTW6_9ROSI|nr:hypothetical protein SLEP1_g4242 [Rubroshorea leprosula]
MGNYVSCMLSTPLIKNRKAARVVLPGGELRQFREPVKAAELMLECPSFFVVNSQALHIGRRFSALGADEELEFGNVYIMFPMKRLNSMVTAADMAVLFMAANSAAKRISGGDVRIQPASGERESSNEDENGGSTVGLEGINEGFLPSPEMNYRLAACRSRKPQLETINEESLPVGSR